MKRERRKLAAIMFTDIAGYSALSQKNEALALELLEKHRALLRPLFSRHKGREVKTIGDAFLVEFSSAVEAVECAIEIQKALQASNALLPAERRIQVRIGIHLGDIVHREGDILGDGVNIASRLQPLAEPGEICLSEQVAVQVRNKIKSPLVSCGVHHLKNIEMPQTTYRIILPWTEKAPARSQASISMPTARKKKWPVSVAAGAGVLALALGLLLWLPKTITRSSQVHPFSIRSLAVLPLQNFSGDPEQEYFADGMTEALITELSMIQDLRVISRTSTMRYKKTEKSLPEIARDLKVDAIVEGSTLLSGAKVRITAQLVKADPEQHLWAKDYKRDARDILSLQSEVAQAIAKEIKVTVTSEEKERLMSSGKVDAEAHQAYLKGRFFIHKFTEEAVLKGKEYLEKAIVLDPNFALAYAGLAECYDIMTSAGWLSPSVGWLKVKEQASRALALDESLSEPHVLLADFRFLVDWDFVGAEDEFLRAIELNPGNATARQYCAIFLSAMERHQDAIGQVRTALDLDPLSLSINQSAGAILRFARQYDRSIEQLEATVALDPGFAWTYWSLGVAFTYKANYEKALEAFERSLLLAGENMALIQADEACAYALWGKAGEARRILAGLQSLSEKKYVSPYSLASVYAALGEKDAAFSWLEKAYQERANSLVFLKVDPRLDGLRPDERLDRLLNRIGLRD